MSKKIQEQFEEKHGVLDRFASDIAYKFGEALATHIGFDTLKEAVEKEIRAFIRTKEFRRLVADDIRKTLTEPTFQQFWSEDLYEMLRDALPKIVREVTVRVSARGRLRGRLDQTL